MERSSDANSWTTVGPERKTSKNNTPKAKKKVTKQPTKTQKKSTIEEVETYHTLPQLTPLPELLELYQPSLDLEDKVPYPRWPQVSIPGDNLPDIQDPKNFAIEMAKLCKQVRERVPIHLSGAMELEYKLNPASLTLYFDPLAWFDHHPNPEQALKEAREWVVHIRSTTTPRDLRFDSIEVDIAKYCSWGGSCRKSSCSDAHGEFWCSETIPRRGGSTQTCGWYSTTELLCLGLSDSHFLVQARQEPQRDLLLVPLPINIERGNFKSHYDNTELMVMPLFWYECVSVSDRISKIINQGIEPLDTISLNFGTWETAQSLDHRAISCHGHGHLSLSASAVEILRNHSDFAFLRGRESAPYSYHLKNCNKLETQRLLAKRLDIMEKKMDSLEERMGSMEERMGSMEAKMDTLIVMVGQLGQFRPE